MLRDFIRGAFMAIETFETVEISNAVDESPAVSWAAVVAGAVATAALTLVLLAFGAGMRYPRGAIRAYRRAHYKLVPVST